MESFCDNLGVGAGAKAVDEADKWLPENKAPDVRHDVRTAAHKQAKDDCRGKYGSAYLGLAGLLAAAVAFGWALVRSRPKRQPLPSTVRTRLGETSR